MEQKLGHGPNFNLFFFITIPRKKTCAKHGMVGFHEESPKDSGDFDSGSGSCF